MSDLLDRASENPDFWNPEPGDGVEGPVILVELFKGRFSTHPVVTLDVDGVPVKVSGARTVLKNKLTELRPKFGDRMAIVYKGMAEGTNYHAYGVAIDTDRSINWDQLEDKSRELVEELPDPA